MAKLLLTGGRLQIDANGNEIINASNAIPTYTEGNNYARRDQVIFQEKVYFANKAITNAPATLNTADWEEASNSISSETIVVSETDGLDEFHRVPFTSEDTGAEVALESDAEIQYNPNTNTLRIGGATGHVAVEGDRLVLTDGANTLTLTPTTVLGGSGTFNVVDGRVDGDYTLADRGVLLVSATEWYYNNSGGQLTVTVSGGHVPNPPTNLIRIGDGQGRDGNVIHNTRTIPVTNGGEAVVREEQLTIRLRQDSLVLRLERSLEQHRRLRLH